VLSALGAKIVRTPTEAAFDDPRSHIMVARRLQRELPRAHILDQYSNPSNPAAHEDGTAAELKQQLPKGDKVDMLVCTAGTGGTITGMARRLRRDYPSCVVVGVDPRGSILAVPDSLNDSKRGESYNVEGIGYDFVPDVLIRDEVNHWEKSEDLESFLMARRIIKEEGMLVGGSSGAALAGALRTIKTFQGGKFNRPDVTVVVVFGDSVRNYMSKFLRDEWMVDNGFLARPSKL